MRQLLCLLACLFLVACASDTEQSKSEDAATHTPEEAAVHTDDVAIQDMVVELATRNVSCGCKLEEVGHCGNYIEIDSKYVEIANGEALGLGKMEWCGKEGVQVESAGVLKDGKFVGATLVKK